MCLSNITTQNVFGGMIKTSENMEFINHYVFDHSMVTLLFYSKCFLVENQTTFLSSGMLLRVCGFHIKSLQVGFFVSSMNTYFQ